MNAWPLLGILVVVAGFAARFNGILVVAAAALVTGLAAGLDLAAVVAAFGKAFNENRYVSIPFLVLPVIGALERAGLQERARMAIACLRGLTTGRVLMLYFLIRQVTIALGLPLGGQATVIRPVVAPMAEAAAETENPALTLPLRERIRAHAAAADNIAAFFGEDIFVAIGSILLMRGFLQQNGILVEPLSLSFWAIPTAIAAFLVHAARLTLFDRALRKGKT